MKPGGEQKVCHVTFFFGISHFVYALVDVAAPSRKNLLARYFTPSRPACPWSVCASPCLHRSHFGSRYQSGRCALRSPPFAPRGFESHCEHFFSDFGNFMKD